MFCPIPKKCPYSVANPHPNPTTERVCSLPRCIHRKWVRMALGEEIQRLCGMKSPSPEEQARLTLLKRRYAQTLTRANSSLVP